MRILALAFSPRFIVYTLSILLAAALLHLAILLPASIPFVALDREVASHDPLIYFERSNLCWRHDVMTV